MQSYSQYIEMGGALRLEGVFLESIVAAYLLTKGEEIVPSPETRGIQHDVLVKRVDGFIFYECTGLSEISSQKIHRFSDDVRELNKRLQESEKKGLTAAYFVAAVHENAWTSEAKDAFQRVKTRLREKLRIDVRLLQGDELLLELLRSGVLGIRLVKDKVYWAGPEDLAIRYNAQSNSFQYGRWNEHYVSKFNMLHFSLLPSFYWESYYRPLFEEAVKDKLELPLSVFTYPDQEGLTWRNIRDAVECFASYLSRLNRTYVWEKGEDFILELHTSKRGYDSYILYLFTSGEQKSQSPYEARYVSLTLLSSLKGKAEDLISKFKEDGKIPKEEKVSVIVVSTTQYWSPRAWGAVKKIPETYSEEVGYSERIPGNELLTRLFNAGILGFRFKEKNQVAIVGDGIPAVRKTVEGLKVASNG